MTNYEWNIDDLNIYDDKELTGIIHSVKYTCINTDNNNKVSGSAILSYPKGTLVGIDNVTKEQVEAWMFSSIGVEGKASTEAGLDSVTVESPTKPIWLNNA